MEYRIGLDLGSTAIKMVLLKGEEVISRKKTPTAPGQESRAQQLIDEALAEHGLDAGHIGGIASTGYGKKLFAQSRVHIDEISANALALFRLSGGEARTVINIGGQDVKILSLSDSGQVIDFKMNDKCAAGTGRFFELVERLLDTPLEQFGPLDEASTQELELNSTCVIFAESEIVSLLAQGQAREDIIKALHNSVARRVAGLMRRGAGPGSVYLDGGPARNPGLVRAIEDELMCEIKVLPHPQYTVALGAALALEA